LFCWRFWVCSTSGRLPLLRTAALERFPRMESLHAKLARPGPSSQRLAIPAPIASAARRIRFQRTGSQLATALLPEAHSMTTRLLQRALVRASREPFRATATAPPYAPGVLRDSIARGLATLRQLAPWAPRARPTTPRRRAIAPPAALEPTRISRDRTDAFLARPASSARTRYPLRASAWQGRPPARSPPHAAHALRDSMPARQARRSARSVPQDHSALIQPPLQKSALRAPIRPPGQPSASVARQEQAAPRYRRLLRSARRDSIVSRACRPALPVLREPSASTAQRCQSNAPEVPSA